MSSVRNRVLAGAAVAGAALVAVTGTAGMADAAKLPGASKTRSFDGGSVSIRLFDESYRISRAVTNIQTSREVLVSGKVRVTTSGQVASRNINVGYVVGCQVNFGGGSGGGSVGGGVDLTGGTPMPDGVGAGPSAQVELSPGKATYVPVIKANVGGQSVDSFNVKSARGGVAYSQERFGVDGCAGRAEAMAKVTVRVATDEFVGNVTMYGKPFSLG